MRGVPIAAPTSTPQGDPVLTHSSSVVLICNFLPEHPSPIAGPTNPNLSKLIQQGWPIPGFLRI